jgi:hypothetical protein
MPNVLFICAGQVMYVLDKFEEASSITVELI